MHGCPCQVTKACSTPAPNCIKQFAAGLQQEGLLNAVSHCSDHGGMCVECMLQSRVYLCVVCWGLEDRPVGHLMPLYLPLCYFSQH